MAGPFGLLSFLQVPPPTGFPDLPGCTDERSEQLEKDQSHFAEDLSLVCRVEPFPFMAWIASRLNPADGPSRRFEKDAKKGD